MEEKKSAIETYEFHLSDGREQLALLHAVQMMVNMQFSSSGSHGSRRYQNHLLVVLSEPDNLINTCRHSRYIQFSVFSCQHVAAHFYYDSFSHFMLIFSWSKGFENSNPLLQQSLFLFIVFFSNLYSSNLARDGLWQFIYKFDDARIFIRSSLVLHMIL